MNKHYSCRVNHLKTGELVYIRIFGERREADNWCRKMIKTLSKDKYIIKRSIENTHDRYKLLEE